MIIQKFGGTSLGSARMMSKALDISSEQLDRAPVLVASAMGKTTNRLLEIAELNSAGQMEFSRAALHELKDAHFTVLVDLVGVPLYIDAKKILESLFTELEEFLRPLGKIQETSHHLINAVLSFGERFSTAIMYYAALQRGIKARLLDSRLFIKTKQEGHKDILLEEETGSAIRSYVDPQPDCLLIAQGFIASDERGRVTTLGRGGSDYSATIIASALDAEEIQIWTDVNGIMSSDPSLIQNVRTIQELNYEEATELAYFGARILHPLAIQPAVGKQIPVLIKNTFNPDGAYSRIYAQGGRTGIQAILGRGNINLVNIESPDMLASHGFLKRIFEVFEKHHLSVDHIASSEVSVSLSIENIDIAVQRDLEKFSTVVVEKDMAVISLVGQELWKQSQTIARIFTTLVDIPVRMISLGSSGVNLILIVPQTQLNKTVQSLHDVLLIDLESANV